MTIEDLAKITKRMMLEGKGRMPVFISVDPIVSHPAVSVIETPVDGLNLTLAVITDRKTE